MEKLTYDEAIKRIRELEAEIESMKAAMPVGMSGWLVTTLNKQYSGITLGVMFRGGQAFIPDGAGAERIAREMQNDLGYQVQRVEDWHSLGRDESDQVRRNMIDVLTTAKVL